MPTLVDRRFPIRADGSADIENLRELPGERHQQDAEHEQHLQEHGGLLSAVWFLSWWAIAHFLTILKKRILRSTMTSSVPLFF